MKDKTVTDDYGVIPARRKTKRFNPAPDVTVELVDNELYNSI